MELFFDTQNNTSATLVKFDKRAMRGQRVAQAEETLQQLKCDIDKRTQQLKQIHNFLISKQALYEQLSQEYAIQPTVDLEKKLSQLKQKMNAFEAKLAQKQPEKLIADLNGKYEKLRSLLSHTWL